LRAAAAAVAALAAASASAPARAAAAPTVVPAASASVKWVGRVAPAGGGAVAFDWEGVSASVTVSGFTYLAVNISDNCAGTPVGGGSRWLVTMTTSNPKTAAPGHRVSTFWTGPLAALYYLFSNPGAHCDPGCDFSGNTTFTLTRLTESRLSGCVPGANLTVYGFVTDGAVLAPPPPAPRRLEFVGDSITAGDLNDGGGSSICGNAAFNDDITLSTGGQLCLPAALGGFGADCMFTAWGGIRLPGTANPADWGMRQLYPFTFSAGGTNAYTNWTFADGPFGFAAQAVVVNLGTNDHPNAPALTWQAAYVEFVTDLVFTYYRNPALVVFLAYGPMTAEYQPFVVNITATLVAAGVSAHTLDLTLPHPMTGCYGHPSAADNVEIAAKALPQIATVMNWTVTEARGAVTAAAGGVGGAGAVAGSSTRRPHA
jgi:hypothetical protein